MKEWNIESLGLPGMLKQTTAGSDSGPSPSSIVPASRGVQATRMKGEEIVETHRIVVGRKPGNVLLELTPRAAGVLRALVGKVCGPELGPRNEINQIYDALNSANVSPIHLRGENNSLLQNYWIQ